MGMRSEWVKVKAAATKQNGGKEIKLRSDSGFGPALDACEAGKKKLSKVPQDKDHAYEWVKAGGALRDTTIDLHKIAKNYLTELEQIKAAVNPVAFGSLADFIRDVMTDAKREVEALEKRVNPKSQQLWPEKKRR
jgi:hypothetical protein